MREVQINRNLKLREDGRLFNIKTGEEFVPTKTAKGYVTSQKRKNKFVHQLVMEYFGPPKPSPDYIILHKNGNNLDNSPDNLEWGTYKDVGKLHSKLPIGHRKCDLSPEEYNRERGKENRKKNWPDYYQKNREKFILRSRQYREDNREKVNERSRIYHQNHKERDRELNKKWTEEHRAYINERNRIRYNTDPSYREYCLSHCKDCYDRHYGVDTEYTNKERERSKIKSKTVSHKIRCKIWQKNNLEKALENRKNWIKKNPEREKENRKHRMDRLSYKNLI